MGKQVLRSASSVAANYRACGRARSNADFTAKMAIVVEEADETVFWLECLTESGVVRAERMAELLTESRELLAIFAAAHCTCKNRRKPIPDGEMAR